MKQSMVAMFVMGLLLISGMAAYATDIVIEGESLVKEEGGKIEVTENRPALSGGKGTKNWNNPNHWVEWEFEVPADGEFKVVLRYCHGRQWTVYRDFKIDGQFPSAEFEKIPWLSTGGFGNKDINDWKNMVVVDKENNPVMLKLTKGKHVIRMTNLGGDGDDGAGNIDAIGLLGKDSDPEKVLGPAGVK